MSRNVRLKFILENIIKEVGDLENIEPYSYKGNTFYTSDNLKVKVYFDLPLTSNLEKYNIGVNRKEATEIAYDIEGIESQYKKTTYKELIKILKTISDIVIKFIESHSEKKALIFFGASKTGEEFTTDKQKNKLYKTIVIYQIGKNLKGWKLKNIDLENNFKGFALLKN
jgi:spore coat protein CotH